MDGTIHYLNTDLDLTSTVDLTALAAALALGDLDSLHVGRVENGLWSARFETTEQHTEPEPNIAAMLAVVESLPTALRSVWASCTLREFNIGYDCGTKPWAFNQGLSSAVLGRIAAVGASLRITIYPDTSEATGAKNTKFSDPL